MDKLYDELLVELECPICLTYMAPPIRQCTTGHSICEPCKKKLPACPLCQGQFTDTKNISLESLARKMHYPCANYKSGCGIRLTLDERENHDRICPYKKYKCFAPKCTWRGNYEEVLDHWLKKKLSSRPYRNTNVCHTNIQKVESYYVNMIQAYDELFWYKFKCNGGKMYWTVQFIGSSEKANDYYFEIEIFKPGQPSRRVLMSEFCQPVELDSRDLFKAGSCVLTTTECVNHLFGDDQLLIYYMRVKEAGDGREMRPPRDQSTSRSSDIQDFERRGTGNAGGAHKKHNFKSKMYKKKTP